MPEPKKVRWSDVKARLKDLNQAELLSLLGDLYKLSGTNQDFMRARYFQNDDALDSHKQIIAECMWPERDGQRFDYRRARKTITNYKKASGDVAGEIDLMIHYVEIGNAFTCEFGDIDETFYDSLLSMCEKAAKRIKGLPQKDREQYQSRLWDLVESSDGIGWGYHDGLADVYYQLYPDA